MADDEDLVFDPTETDRTADEDLPVRQALPLFVGRAEPTEPAPELSLLESDPDV